MEGSGCLIAYILHVHNSDVFGFYVCLSARPPVQNIGSKNSYSEGRFEDKGYSRPWCLTKHHAMQAYGGVVV
jgi:hypothetical protein